MSIVHELIPAAQLFSERILAAIVAELSLRRAGASRSYLDW